MSRQILIHSAALDLKEALERAKLPKGVRWAAGGVAVVNGVAYGLLTRAPRRGEQRPTVEVKCDRKENVTAVIADAVRRLG